MHAFLPLAGLLGGAALALQAAVNAQLVRGLGHPVLAGAVSFFSGILAIWTVVLLLRVPLAPIAEAASRLPHYAWWAGGVLGATYLCINIWLVPRLGAAAVVVLAVAGQILTALALDHWGLLRLPVHPATPARLLGALLVLVGVWLVVRR